MQPWELVVSLWIKSVSGSLSSSPNLSDSGVLWSPWSLQQSSGRFRMGSRTSSCSAEWTHGIQCHKMHRWPLMLYTFKKRIRYIYGGPTSMAVNQVMVVPCQRRHASECQLQESNGGKRLFQFFSSMWVSQMCLDVRLAHMRPTKAVASRCRFVRTPIFFIPTCLQCSFFCTLVWKKKRKCGGVAS